MITIQPHISKLEALNKYMDCWIAYRYAWIVLIRNARDYPGIRFPIPEKIPPFEEWYELYQSVNN